MLVVHVNLTEKQKREKNLLQEDEAEFLEFSAKAGDIMILFHPAENYTSQLCSYLILSVDKQFDSKKERYVNESMIVFEINDLSLELFTRKSGDYNGNVKASLIRP
jgi:citrate lyase gamma subunit